MILDLPDRAALDRFAAEQPRCGSGIFEAATIRLFRQAAPEPAPGLPATALAKAAAAEYGIVNAAAGPQDLPRPGPREDGPRRKREVL